MKFTVTAPKPRNPIVAAARLRLAGSHRRSGSAVRQRSRHQLRHELDQLDRRSDRHRYSP
jgi:hypothetical protein